MKIENLKTKIRQRIGGLFPSFRPHPASLPVEPDPPLCYICLQAVVIESHSDYFVVQLLECFRAPRKPFHYRFALKPDQMPPRIGHLLHFICNLGSFELEYTNPSSYNGKPKGI